MKKLILILIVLFLLIPTSALALEVEARIGQILYNDSEIRAGNSLEVRVKYKSVFIFGERDNLLMYGTYFDINSIGIGFDQTISDGLNFYLKVGYYIPQYNKDGFDGEGLYYRQIKYWCPALTPIMFQHYSVVFDSDFGGEIGLNFKKRVWKSLYLGISGGYRYLRINEYVCGWNDGGAAGVTGWILEQNRDFGGWLIGAGFEWRF